MGCPITLAGIELSCKGTGGIKSIMIADKSVITDITLNASTNTISAITKATGGKFYQYALRRQTGSFECTINADDASATVYYETTLEVSFTMMSTAKRVELQALAIGNLVIIVLDNNGVYWLMGYDNPASLTGGGASTGSGFGDANQYSATITDIGKFLPIEVDDSIIAGLLT